jgi:hypothetical protein
LTDDIHKKVGHDFPGETILVPKEKEEKKYGEYRTRRLVLEAWDKLYDKGEVAE